MKPSGVWRWREVKLVDSMWAHVFLPLFCIRPGHKEIKFGSACFQTHARVSDSLQHVHEIKPMTTTRWMGFSAHLSLLLSPPINHKFTPVLIFTSSMLSHFPLGASLDPAFPFSPLSLCCISVRWHLNKSSPDITKKALKSSFPPTCWLKAHVNKWFLTATVHLLFSYSP